MRCYNWSVYHSVYEFIVFFSKRRSASVVRISDGSSGVSSSYLARLRAAARGAPPILLLDELAAHLDAVRRAALFEEICALGAQAWLTGTDRVLFAGLEGRAQFVTVENAAFGLQPVAVGS